MFTLQFQNGCPLLSLPTEDDDYTAVSRTIQFNQFTRSHHVSIPIIDDSSPESTETFTISLQLQSDTQNVVLVPSIARITIQDDDGTFLLHCQFVLSWAD